MGDFKDESAHNLGPLTMQIRRSTVGTGDNYGNESYIGKSQLYSVRNTVARHSHCKALMRK